MSLPTGTLGQSWKNQAYAIPQGAEPVELAIPVTHSVYYTAPLGLYEGCAVSFVLVQHEISAFTSSLSLVGSTGQRVDFYRSSTTFPGLIDTIIAVIPGFTSSFEAGLGETEIWWMVLSGTARVGLLITTESMPHIAIDPLDFMGSRYPGDIYMVPGGVNNPRGLKIVDRNVTNTLYTGTFLTSIKTANVSTVSARFGGVDNPTASYLGANSIITNEGFFTVTSSGQGALIRNTTWQGGFYMPNSSSISLLTSGLILQIPTGSQLFVSNSLNLQEGRIYIRGNGVGFSMDDFSSSAYINGQHWVHLTSSVVSVVDIGTGAPALEEGTFLYVIPTTGSQVDEAHIRTSGSWYPVNTASFDLLDGGTY